MRPVSLIALCIIGVLLENAIALPCMSNDTKTKFEAARKALTDLGNDIKNKITKLDSDMGVLVSDFKSE